MKVSKKTEFLMKLAKAVSIIARKLGGMGLGFGDLAVLYAISQSPEGRIRRVDLAEAVGLTASGVTRLLVPLEKIGVVKREANKYDARVSYVAMTKSGKELFENTLKWVEMKVDEMIPDGHLKKLDQANDVLDHIS